MHGGLGRRRVVALTVAFIACAGWAAQQGVASHAAAAARFDAAKLVPHAATVYDGVNRVYWLADADLAATMRFGLPSCPAPDGKPCVNGSGSMTYASAVAWVKAMDSHAYLGVKSWQLPTTPNAEPHTATLCPRLGPKPYRNRFGFDCTDNGLGFLFYDGLRLSAPNTAVAMPPNRVGPLRDVQPYLYWSSSSGSGGHRTFSFGNGFAGANTDPNFSYVWPAIVGKLPGTPSWRSKRLQVNPGGATVYDPQSGVTFLADANLAAGQTFGLPRCVTAVKPAICVERDGAMTWPAAAAFIKRMNRGGGYLHHKLWALPPIAAICPSYGCTGSANPMGSLFYSQFGLRSGDSAVSAPNVAVGPFNHVRPYLYWSCEANAIRDPCAKKGAAPNFEWSFSFGDGFLGTDVVENELYATAYYVVP